MEEAKKLIQQVVEMLNRDNKESRVVWYILSALRGPDSDKSNVKTVTTARLRGAIGMTEGIGLTISHEPISNAFMGSTVESLLKIRDLTGVDESYHFTLHFSQAVRAAIELGLIKRENLGD